MNIRVLLASKDTNYIQRLANAISQFPSPQGTFLELEFFAEEPSTLDESRNSGKFHIALVDESMLSLVSAPVFMILTDDDTLNDKPYGQLSAAIYLYKYQQVMGIVRSIILAQARVCAFFSPTGGSGTSTVAMAFAMAAADVGVKPLYVSFEYFNSTELFFNDTGDTHPGLYDVFGAIAEGSAVTTAIDTAKVKDDATGIYYLKRFGTLMELEHIQLSAMEIFIYAIRVANDIDLVILDLGSGFTPLAKGALRYVDEIYVVADLHDASILKLKMLFDECSSFFKTYIGQAHLIYNNRSGLESPNNNFRCKSLTLCEKQSEGIHIDKAKSLKKDLKMLIDPTWNRDNVR